MKKYAVVFLAFLFCSGCAMVSKQYYYVPSVPHQTFKNRLIHSDFKMIYNKVGISDRAGDSIGSVTVSNGVGHPLMMGPLLPVIPVGGLFEKRDSRFILELTVKCNEGYFMPLAIDSINYKRVRDSLNALRISTKATLNSGRCYMIVNDTLRVPLNTSEFLMGNTAGHSYWMTADIKFRKVKTMRLVTGNALLDSTLKNVSFVRKSRIKFDLLMLGY